MRTGAMRYAVPAFNIVNQLLVLDYSKEIFINTDASNLG